MELPKQLGEASKKLPKQIGEKVFFLEKNREQVFFLEKNGEQLFFSPKNTVSTNLKLAKK